MTFFTGSKRSEDAKETERRNTDQPYNATVFDIVSIFLLQGAVGREMLSNFARQAADARGISHSSAAL